MKIVCISDTHTKHEQVKVPDGDMLIHAGDFTYDGRKKDVRDFLLWFSQQRHRYKIFIAGNHDRSFEEHPDEMRYIVSEYQGVTYLQDQGLEIEGLCVYGSPWQPEFQDWAFNLPRGVIGEKWAKIPEYVDVLITHGPPSEGLGGLLAERAFKWGNATPEDVGDEALLEHIKRVKPKLHVCGHIHIGYGLRERYGTLFVNASVVDEAYDVVHEPIVVEL